MKKFKKLRILQLFTRRFSRRDGLMICIGGLLALIIIGMTFAMQHGPVPLKPEALRVTIPWLPPTVKRWEGPITEMANKYSIDPNLVAIIMTVESGGFAKADSGYAQGLMQVAPTTAKDIARKHLKQPVTNYDLWDPKTNIEFGTAYLAYLRDTFGKSNQGPSWDGTVELVAAGYNGGPGAAGNLSRGNGLQAVETASYSRDVYNMWRERKAAASPTFDRWKERGGVTLINKAEAQ